jgi:hypothetical protein
MIHFEPPTGRSRPQQDDISCSFLSKPLRGLVLLPAKRNKT